MNLKKGYNEDPLRQAPAYQRRDEWLAIQVLAVKLAQDVFPQFFENISK